MANLIHNAIKFTPPGGAVVVRSHRGAVSLMIEVSDDGPGIVAGEIAFLFKRFSATSTRPTGGEKARDSDSPSPSGSPRPTAAVSALEASRGWGAVFHQPSPQPFLTPILQFTTAVLSLVDSLLLINPAALSFLINAFALSTNCA